MSGAPRESVLSQMLWLGILLSDDYPNRYAVHKASSERALFQLHASSGFPVTTFRPPFVHGPRQPFYREAFFWDRLRSGRPIILPDGGDAPMQWVFVSDLAEACVRRPRSRLRQARRSTS